MNDNQIRDGFHSCPRSRARRGHCPVPGAQNPLETLARMGARFGGVPPSRIERAWHAMTDEFGGITVPVLIGFFMLCGAAGCAWGYMMP